MRAIRGNDISMIFQEPMTSLNPVLTIGRQITETLTLHQGLDRGAAEARATEMLRLVGIPEPAQRIRQYPHELSGGMRQRVMIAMALACNPKLLIADEPTTALDVTVQAQILDLMRQLKSKTGAAIILITHSLGLVAEMAAARRRHVRRAGRSRRRRSQRCLPGRAIPTRRPCSAPCRGSAPRWPATAPDRLAEIPGVVPSLKEAIAGCIFAPRCQHATAHCREAYPPLEEKDGRATGSPAGSPTGSWERRRWARRPYWR